MNGFKFKCWSTFSLMFYLTITAGMKDGTVSTDL